VDHYQVAMIGILPNSAYFSSVKRLLFESSSSSYCPNSWQVLQVDDAPCDLWQSTQPFIVIGTSRVESTSRSFTAP